ncbi:MAG: PAS domain S-box protein, partial [Bacteroidota bacterium]
MKPQVVNSLDFEAFFHVASYMFCIANVEGYFLEVNQAFTEVLGYNKEELIRQPFLEFIHPEDIASTMAEMERLVAGEIAINFQNRYRTKDGSYKVLEWNTKPIEGDGVLYAIARDITPQVDHYDELHLRYTQSQEEVHQSNIRFQSLYNTAPDMMASVDPKTGGFIHVNQQMSQKLGYSYEELIGMPVFQIFNAESIQKAKTLLLQFRETGKIEHEQLVVQTKDGFHFPVELNAQAVRNEEGEILFSTSILRDISLRETNRINYEQANKRLQRIADLSSSVIYLFDVKKKKNIFSNRQLVEQLGYSIEEAQTLGADFLPGIVHHEDLDEVMNHLQQVLPNLPDGEIALITYRVKHKKTGQYVWLQSIENVFERADDGSVSVILGYATDITAQQERQLQLDLVSKRLEKISQISPSIFYVLDLDSKQLQYINEAVQPILGYTPEEVLAMGNQIFQTIIHPDHLPTALHNVQHVTPHLEDGELVSYDALIRHKNGAYKVWVQISYTVFDRNPDGTVKSTMGILTDITERKEKEKALAELTQRLEKITHLSPSIIYLYDVKSQQNIYTNRSITEDLGYTSEDLQRMGDQVLKELIHPDDYEQVVELFTEKILQLKDGEILSNENRSLHKKTGKYEWYQNKNIVFERAPDGSVKTILG